MNKILEQEWWVLFTQNFYVGKWIRFLRKKDSFKQILHNNILHVKFVQCIICCNTSSVYFVFVIASGFNLSLNMLNEGEVLYPVVMNYKDLRFSVDGSKQLVCKAIQLCFNQMGFCFFLYLVWCGCKFLKLSVIKLDIQMYTIEKDYLASYILNKFEIISTFTFEKNM